MAFTDLTESVKQLGNLTNAVIGAMELLESNVQTKTVIMKCFCLFPVNNGIFAPPVIRKEYYY